MFPLYQYSSPFKKSTNLSPDFITKLQAQTGLVLLQTPDAKAFTPSEDASLLQPSLGMFKEYHGLFSVASDTPDLSQSIPDINTIIPEDVFYYTYAVFYSPMYRERYAEFLKIDFPRLPLTSDVPLFRALSGLGEQLTTLHLMEQTGPNVAAFPVKGSNIVEAAPRYTEPGQGAAEGRVYINKTQYFAPVPPEVWAFQIGGYQVCHKWLKDRKGRTLSDDDITHYGRVVAALGETIRLMAEIDAVIEEHGGWPLQ